MFLNKSLIIIPTKDRCKEIKQTLKRLKKLKINSKKIIVIDSSVEKNFFKNKKVYVKIKNNFLRSTPSISKQRNIGLKFASSINGLEYIFFLDDDIRITKKSLLEMNQALIKYN